ncbi:MAG: ATP-binding protein [Rhodothermales bacterium]
MATRENRVFQAIYHGDRFEIKALPEVDITGEMKVERFEDEVRILTNSGMIAPMPSKHGFTLRFINYGSSPRGDSLLAVSQAGSKSHWMLYSGAVDVIRCMESGCQKESPEVLRYPRWNRPAFIYVDSTGIAWISSGTMLVRYDPRVKIPKSYEARFPALVRRITTIDSNHLLYGGIFHENDGAAAPQALSFENNALRFEFALPSYNDPAGNEFQYYLEGKDAGWSEWTKETSKNYTNLFEGSYKFHIRGRNAQLYISSESVYSFQILPPWFRSIWAYGTYMLVFVSIGLFARTYRRMVVENRTAREQAKELAREKEVNERLNDLNKRLQQANETLRQADRMKDEFLANTSHELRTPLTGILGCASILRDEVTEDQTEFIDMIEENGQRLLRTLDSLLNLARLRAGLMDLDYSEVNVGDKAFAVARTYEQLAEKKNIVLNLDVQEDVQGQVDDHCLDCILNHLIGNAVKFTEQGSVDISISKSEGEIAIKVQDTGIGIDAEFLPFLFDEFKQESTGLTRQHEGNGLGLAVTARIVELMNGEIDVRSVKGVGSTFTIYLPAERRAEESHRPVRLHSSNDGQDRAAA